MDFPFAELKARLPAVMRTLSHLDHLALKRLGLPPIIGIAPVAPRPIRPRHRIGRIEQRPDTRIAQRRALDAKAVQSQIRPNATDRRQHVDDVDRRAIALAYRTDANPL